MWILNKVQSSQNDSLYSIPTSTLSRVAHKGWGTQHCACVRRDAPVVMCVQLKSSSVVMETVLL